MWFKTTKEDIEKSSLGGRQSPKVIKATTASTASTTLATTTSNQTMETKGTRDLFLQTLTAIGCQYDIGEGEDDRIHFAFQGEHFLVDADNENSYLYIYDYSWGSVELYDIDDVSRLRKAINETNWRCSVTTVYTIDETAKTMLVHSKMTVLFVPQIVGLETYLKSTLTNFFRAHQLVGGELEKLRKLDEQSEGK